MTDDLINCYKSEKKLLPFLHLPVQSGSDDVLKNMNRKHTREQYLDIVAKLKKINSEINFSSDFIVGYPGESQKDFDDTISLIKSVNFIKKQEIRIARTIEWLENNWKNYNTNYLTMDQIAIACALDYSIFRFNNNWKKDCPKLTKWFEDFTKNEFMKSTSPSEKIK